MTTTAHQDNLFGICARMGEDFGFDPLWLRLAFAGVLILNPFVVIGAYFALGAMVVASRTLFPRRVRGTVAVLPVAETYEPLPLAA